LKVRRKEREGEEADGECYDEVEEIEMRMPHWA
jgi:hypothetical protein